MWWIIGGVVVFLILAACGEIKHGGDRSNEGGR